MAKNKLRTKNHTALVLSAALLGLFSLSRAAYVPKTFKVPLVFDLSVQEATYQTVTSGTKAEPNNTSNLTKAYFLAAENVTLTPDGQKSVMTFDPNYQKIAIPFKGKNSRKEGVVCQQDQTSQFELKNQIGEQCSYLGTSSIKHKGFGWGQTDPQGYEAKTTWEWESKPPKNNSDLNQPQTDAIEFKKTQTFETQDLPLFVKFGLISSPTTNWALGEAGIFGLSPSLDTATSNLFTYLKNAYKWENDTIYATFYLTTSRDSTWIDTFTGTKKTAYQGSQLRISDNLKDILDDPMAIVPNTSSSGHWFENTGKNRWSLGGARLIYNDSGVEKELIQSESSPSKNSICLNLNSNSTFIAKTPSDFKTKTNDVTCRGAVCGPGSFLLNGPDLVIQLADIEGKQVNLTLLPQNYQFQSPDTSIEVSVDDFKNFTYNGCNPENDLFGLGRMFFFNYQVVFMLNKNGTSKIGIFKYKARPSLTQYANVTSLVIAGVSFVCFLYVYIMAVKAKNLFVRDDTIEENYYQKSGSGSAGRKSSGGSAGKLPTIGEDAGEGEIDERFSAE